MPRKKVEPMLTWIDAMMILRISLHAKTPRRPEIRAALLQVQERPDVAKYMKRKSLEPVQPHV